MSVQYIIVIVIHLLFICQTQKIEETFIANQKSNKKRTLCRESIFQRIENVKTKNLCFSATFGQTIPPISNIIN